MPVLRGVTMGNIGVIYRILKALDVSMDYEEFDEGILSAARLGISEPRRLYLLHMLLDAGLIEGIAIEIDCAGNFYISKGRPRLTLKGLEYMNNNSLMQRAMKAAKGIKDSIPGV